MTLKLPALVLALFVGAVPALAQTTGHDHNHGGSASVAQPAGLVNGEVRKIDKEQGKLTLSHDAIPNLEMPKMTMVFRVKEQAFLDHVKTGDKVKFAADRIGGQLTVVALEPAK